MDAQVLVLDRGYQPMARVSWQRAISLLFLGKIEVVEEYEDKEIRTVSFSCKVPSIVRVIATGVFRKRWSTARFSRHNVYMRDNGQCMYCGKGVPRSDFTFDHVVPRAQGGGTCWENVVICCVPCNWKKANRTPAQASMKLIKAPVRPPRLPDQVIFTLIKDKNTPASWKQYLRNAAYWLGELDEEQGLK